MTALDSLIDFIKQFQFSELPESTIHQTKRALLDNLAAVVLGARETDVADIAAYLDACGNGPGNATVVGREKTYPFLDAVCANAYLCQVHDANDGFAPDTIGGNVMHPGRIVVPSALSIAEKYRLRGQELLMLVLLGYEAAGRIRGIEKFDHRLGYVASLMLGRVLKLDNAVLRNAMGFAFYHTPAFCLLDYTGKGLDDFALAQGRVARAGVESTFLAMNGFLCPTLAPDVEHEFRVDLDELGERFHVHRLYLKPFPACRSVHGPAEAAMDLCREHDFAIEDIVSCTIELPHNSMYTERPISIDDVNRITSAAHPRYLTACGLVDGEIRLERFQSSGMKDPQIFDLVDRMTVDENPEFSARYGQNGCRPIRVTVELKDGRTLVKENEHALGGPASPVSDAQICEKFRRYSGDSLTREHEDRIFETVFALDEVSNTSDLMSLLRYQAR